MAVLDRNLAIAAFRKEAEKSYQSGSKTRDTVMRVTGIKAESYRFPVFGPTDANVRGEGQDVTPAVITNAKPTAMLTPRESFSYIDIQTQAITNVDYMATRGSIHGLAIAREWDRDVIDVLKAWDANAYTRDDLNAAGMTITTPSGGGMGNNLGSGKLDSKNLRQGVTLLKNEDVGVDGAETCSILAGAWQFAELAEEDKFISMDYLEGRATGTGRFGQLYGCRPILIGQNARRVNHGRLPDDEAYLYAKSAIGLAEGVTEKMGIVQLIHHKRAYMVGAEANGGATRIQNAGIVIMKMGA